LLDVSSEAWGQNGTALALALGELEEGSDKADEEIKALIMTRGWTRREKEEG